MGHAARMLTKIVAEVIKFFRVRGCVLGSANVRARGGCFRNQRHAHIDSGGVAAPQTPNGRPRLAHQDSGLAPDKSMARRSDVSVCCPSGASGSADSVQSFSTPLSGGWGAAKSLQKVSLSGMNRAAQGIVNASAPRLYFLSAASPTPRNPDHATMSGITPQQAEQLFTPTVPNPSRGR